MTDNGGVTTLPASTTEPAGPGIPALPHLLLVVLILGGCGTVPLGGRRSVPTAGLAAANRTEPAISGNGRLLASLMEQDGKLQVILQELDSGRRLPLPHWRGHTPHGSPSLSWNGRYLAGLVQQGNTRRVLVDDRLSGRLLRLPLPGGGEPQRLSLAPDGTRLAVEMLRNGQRQVQLFALNDMLEPDLPGGRSVLGGGTALP